MDVNITQFVTYAGHSVAASGVISLILKAQYSELTNTIRLMQLLNNDIYILARLPGVSKPIKLGYFKIKNVVIDGDGQSKIKFSGIADYIEVDQLNLLPSKGDIVTEFKVRYQASVEEEEER